MKTTEIHIVFCEKVICGDKEYIINAFKNKEKAQDYFNTLVDSFAYLINKNNWKKDEFPDGITDYCIYDDYTVDHIEIRLTTQKLR